MSGAPSSLPTTAGAVAASLGQSPLDQALGGALHAYGRLARRFGVVGFRQLAGIIRRLRRGEGLISVNLNQDSTFTFPLADRYWSRPMLVGDEPYEPEIAWLLHAAAKLPYALLDCGANMGYWSILASSALCGRRPVVAIEAARSNFALLLENARTNGGRFRAIHRAVAEASGRTVLLYGKRHDSHSLRPDWNTTGNAAQSEAVETISLDDAAAQFLPDRSFPPLVKLDVEGVEIDVLKGAGRVLAEGALIVYEDHGREPDHPVSAFVLALDGMEVWRLDDHVRPFRVTTLEQVAAVKQDPRRGYNFFAVRGDSPWVAVFRGG